MKKLKKFLFLFLISTLLLFTISGSLYLYFFYSKSNELNKDIGSNPVVNESDSIFDEKKALNLIQDIQLSINQIYKKWEPAVIRIKIIKKEPVKNDKNDNSKNNNSLLIDNYFTGFFIDPNGLILTTYQNISDKNGKINESEIFVFFKDKKYPIQLIGKDIVSNLVLIKINHTNTPYIPILDIQPEKEIGNFCISIGKGFSFKKDDGFISFGVISGLDRIAYSVSDKYSLHKEFIQTDIPMVKENEGGPLFNIKGGIYWFKY